MPERHLRPLSTAQVEARNVFRGAQSFDRPGSDIVRAGETDSGWIAAADTDQFDRDIAAIERATATLCRAEPALQSWAEPPASLNTPRPLWLVIGVLWVSTAFVALSAVLALHVLTG